MPHAPNRPTLPQLLADVADDRARIAEVAAATGVQPLSVRAWIRGQTVPLVQRLPSLARVLDVELAVVCNAAGRPIDEVLRASYAADPELCLAGRLRRWHDTNGHTARTAAAAIGCDRFSISRWMCGSMRLPLKHVEGVAGVLELTIYETVSLAYPGESDQDREMRAWAAEVSRPSAVLIREHLQDAKLPFRAQKGLATIGRGRLTALACGKDTPNVEESVVLARELGVGLPALLLAAGTDPAQVSAIVSAVARTPAHRGTDGRKVIADVRDATPFVTSRGARRDKLPWQEMQRRTGIDRTRLIHIVRGDRRRHGALNVDECMRLATALDVDQAQMLAGFGHHL